MGKDKIRWGVIGCGSVAEVKSVPAYQQTDGFEVAMVMRRNAEKAADYVKRHSIPQWTTDARKVIENPEIDAVYIATPPDSHKHYGLWVAQVGKPCCIEKPMAPNYQDSLAINQAFQKKKIPLFIAYYRRSLPRFLQIKKWLDEGQIGKVRHVRWLKTKTPSLLDMKGDHNWRTDAKVARGGYFDDLASHGLDLITFLLGDIQEAKGFARNIGGLYTAYDSVTGTWVHTNGVTGEGCWNFLTHHRRDVVEILGSRGSITFAVLDESPIVLENEEGKEVLEIPHPEHIQKYHVENIRNQLLGTGVHPSLGKSGLHTSWVMDAILGAQ